MEQLKKCPFCGGEAYEYRSGLQFSLCEIVCKDCGCRTERMAVADAYAAWNTRKPMERIVERLEDNSTWTDPTYDMDGYSNEDETEVINLQTAIQIVREEM